jgi:hypothetical protein
VIGRSLLVNGAPHDIIGIMPPGFRGLVVTAPDYWAPLGLLGQFRPALAGKEDEVQLEVVGRLKPGLSPEMAMAGLTVWAAGNPEMQESNGRPKTIHLMPRQGTTSSDVFEGAVALRAALLRVRANPDDRLRERREPAAGARRRAAA